MKQTVVCKSLQELPNIAKMVLNQYSNERLFVIQGSMGVGKTTFIKEVCRILGVDNIVNSPTYAIINEYHTFKNESVYHFDFYRIKNKEEVLDLGYEEYFFSGNFCFMEWAEKIKELLPENVVYILIEKELNNEWRKIKF